MEPIVQTQPRAQAEPLAESEPVVPAIDSSSPVTSFIIHFDRPASFLVQNLGQEIGGWIAAPEDAKSLELQFTIDGCPVNLHSYRREDVERVHSGRHVIGWTFWLEPARTFQQPRRTIELRASLGDRWTYTRHFFKSKSLMSAGRDSPIYFMHIPKTAGTALRAYVDFAFSNFPSMLVYGDAPGVAAEHIAGSYRVFAKTREMFFGHFDFDLTRRLHDVHPKVITVFRPPADLVRSYLNFNVNPSPEFLDNPLVRHICGLSYTPPCGLIQGKHLDKALRLVDEHFHVVQQSELQQFADELSTGFGLPRFEVPRVNISPTDVQREHALSANITYDAKLYEACLHRPRNFLEFLNA
jgi:hypothetical protein